MQSHELESVQTAISDLFDALSDLYSEIPDPETSAEAALLEIAFDDLEAIDSLVEILNDDISDSDTEDEDEDDEGFDESDEFDDLDFDDEDLDEDDFLTDEVDEFGEPTCDCCFCQAHNS